MSYDTNALLLDVNGKPIPQYYDVTTDAFLPMSKEVLLGASTSEIGKAKISGSVPLTVDVIIANGQSLSAGVDCTGKRIAQIIMPADWTAANLTFQSCATIDGTYQNMYDGSGAEVVEVAADDRNIAPLNAVALSDLMFLKVRSGTAASAVAQGAERTITLVLA